MTIWIIPMGKHSKYFLRKSLQRILGRFQISFQEGGFLYVEGKGALEEDTRDGHVSPSGNGCTCPWLGYVQQFDLQKVFVFCYGSYHPLKVKYGIWKHLPLEKEKHGQTPPILSNFLRCWCFFLPLNHTEVPPLPSCIAARVQVKSWASHWASTVPWSVWVADW